MYTSKTCATAKKKSKLGKTGAYFTYGQCIVYIYFISLKEWCQLPKEEGEQILFESATQLFREFRRWKKSIFAAFSL